MKSMRPWDVFFKEKMTKTLSEKKRVIDTMLAIVRVY